MIPCTANSIRPRTGTDGLHLKIEGGLDLNTRAESPNHRSRGHHPRLNVGDDFRPERANQMACSFTSYWAALSGRNHLSATIGGDAPAYYGSGFRPGPKSRAESSNHRSRGPRPRYSTKDYFCPERALYYILVYIYAPVIACFERAHHFFNQSTPSFAGADGPRTYLGVSIVHSSKHGMHVRDYRRRGGSRSRLVQPDEKVSHGQGPGNSKKRFVKVCKNVGFKPTEFPLAGRIWPFRRQSIAFRTGKKIYSQPGIPSQKGNFSGRISLDLEKISGAVRRAIFVGLNPSRDALSGRNFFNRCSGGDVPGYDGPGLRPYPKLNTFHFSIISNA